MLRLLSVKTVAERIRHARELTGLSQADLAKHSGISSSYLCQAEQGDAPDGTDGVIRNPSVEKLRAIASALGVRFEWLALGLGSMRERKRGAA